MDTTCFDSGRRSIGHREIICLVIIFVWTLAQPCAAHAPLAPSDPVLDRVSNASVSLVTVALAGAGCYLFLKWLAAQYERQKKRQIEAMTVQAITLTATSGVMLLLWHLVGPAPVATASGPGHIDTPNHGGQIQAMGDNHLEAVIGPDGGLTLYVLGITPTLPFPIPAQALWGQARAAEAGDAPASVLLHPAPQPGEPNGQASVFVGQIPARMTGKPINVTVSVPLAGREQKVSFDTGPASAGVAATAHDTAATRVVATAVTPAERALFLTPGGAYTAADIGANGGQTPEQKFQGLMADHHLKPQKGAFICPITKTLANKKFAWTVRGKAYLFCCPPCIAEFVKQAKAHPEGLCPPQTYIQN